MKELMGPRFVQSRAVCLNLTDFVELVESYSHFHWVYMMVEGGFRKCRMVYNKLGQFSSESVYFF